MALSPSSLSQACRSIANFVHTRLGGTTSDITVVIGNPYDAANATADGSHRLNLFFYRFEPSGFDPDLLPGEPWLIRLHCLFTAFSLDEDNRSAGENDLRILGEVMRVFHETPVLSEMTVEDDTVRLAAIYEALSLDDLNHIWSTQSDVSFRPSVSYELALAPVVPSERDTGAPIAATIGVEAQPGMPPSAPFGGSLEDPGPVALTVDTSPPDWAPHIALVSGDDVAFAANFEVGSPELAAFVPRIWVAGATGAPVTFRWDTWTDADGWQSTPAGVGGTATGVVFDPANPPDTDSLAQVSLPFDDHPGQAVLRAERAWTRPDGSIVRLASNPVAISLWGGP